MLLFKKAVLLTTVLLSLTSAGILGSGFLLHTWHAGTIPQGISVKGHQLGGLSLTEAARLLEQSLPNPIEHELQLTGPDRIHHISLSDINAAYDYLTTARKASEYYKDGNLFNQLLYMLKIRAKPNDLPVSYSYSEEKLLEKITRLQTDWDTNPKNAHLLMDGDRIVIIPEQVGYALNLDKTVERCGRAISEGRIHVEAVGQVLQPEITSKSLEVIDKLLAVSNTNYSESTINRSQNIVRASDSINGVFLREGEIFSLNNRLGPRLAETGYLIAPVIMQNRISQGIGGGICQVASTLYNAVLQADLKVLERHPHTRPVNYISPGLDATISGDYLDLKFMNNSSAPVYISSEAAKGNLTVRIFGSGSITGHTIRISSIKTPIEPKVEFIHDSNLPTGEIKVKNPGKKGYQVRVYREVVINGQADSKTLISTDYYNPVSKVILVGAKQKEEEK